MYKRDVAGDLGELDRPVRRLTLELGRPGERVEPRVGVAAGHRLGDEHVDGDAVLGVHHDHRPGLAGVLHRPQDLPVVGVEHARVGHEQLEAGDPFVVDEVRHRLEGVLVDAADDLVEAVVDGAVAVGLVVPLGEAVLNVLARALDGEVDDRRDSSPGRGDRPGLERVGRGRPAEWQFHVGVDVDATGDDVLPGGVDAASFGIADATPSWTGDRRRSGSARSFGIAGLPSGDPESLCLPGGEHGGDRLAVDQHVGLDAARGADDRAAANQDPRHHASTISS